MTISLEGLAGLTDAALVALANGMWPGVAVALVVWCFFRVTSYWNAVTRYVVWWAVMSTVVILPVLMGLAPNESPPALRVNPTVSSPVSPWLVPGETRDPQPLSASSFLSKVEPEAPSMAVPLPNAMEARNWELPIRLAPRRWSAHLGMAWLIITLVLLGRVTWSFFHLRSLKTAGTPLAHLYQNRLKERLSSSGLRRPVALLSSERVSGPMVAGLARPAIVLPQGLAERLTEEELDQLVLHELAHLHRRDDWTNVGQKIIECLFFVHPAVWFIGRQLDMDREIACDDWAITQTGKPTAYAACLTRLVELTGRVKTPALAPGGWTTRKQIVRRIEMSLNRSRNSSPHVSRIVVLVSLAILVLIGLQAVRTSPLVVAAPALAYESTHESVQAAERGVLRALQEDETGDSQSEASLPETEAGALRDRAERLEREAQARMQSIERQVRRQQQALARQQREIQRQANPVERARTMTLGERYQAEGPPISEDELIELMLEIAQNDSDSEVREAAFRSIGLMGSDKATEALIALYDSLHDLRLQRVVVASLGVRGQLTDSAITKLREIAIAGGNLELQQAAVGTLAHAGGDRGVDALLYIYEAPQVGDETDLKKWVIHALGLGGNGRAVEKLKQIAKSDPDASLRLEAVRSFVHLGSAHDFGARAVSSVRPVSPVRPSEPAPAAPPAPPAPEKQ